MNRHSTSLVFNLDERMAALRAEKVVVLDQSGFCGVVCDYARAEFNVAHCIIRLVKQDQLWFRHLAGEQAGDLPDQRFVMAMLMRTPVVDIQAPMKGAGASDGDPGSAAACVFYAGAAIRTFDGFLLGVLSLEDNCAQPLPTAKALMMLESLASLLGRWIDSAMGDAYLDPMTGLPNQDRFLENLHACRVMPDHGKSCWSVIVVECSQNVSDPHDVVSMVGQRLRSGLSPDVSIYRLDDANYAVVVDTKNDAIPEVEYTLHRVLELFTAPFFLQQRPIIVDVSVRVAPITMEACITGMAYFFPSPESAQYTSTRQLRYGFSENVQRLTMAHDLAGPDIRIDQYVLRIVATLDLSSGDTVALEGDIVSRVDGVMLNAEYTMLRAHDLMVAAQLVEWYLTAALPSLNAASAANPGLRLMCPVPGRIFIDETFANRFSRALMEHDIDPGRVDIVLDERAMLQHLDQVHPQVVALRELGCGVIVDNFGSGGTTLDWLSSFPVSAVRLNALFVHAATADRQFYNTISILTAVARACGLPILGKDVSTPRMREALAGWGCMRAAGELFGYHGSDSGTY